MPIDGRTYAVTLPISINSAMAGFCTINTPDVANIIVAAYWVSCTTTTFSICTDYEIGQGYGGTGVNNVAWFLLSY